MNVWNYGYCTTSLCSGECIYTVHRVLTRGDLIMLKNPPTMSCCTVQRNTYMYYAQNCNQKLSVVIITWTADMHLPFLHELGLWRNLSRGMVACELGPGLSASFGSLISLLSAIVNFHAQSVRECATKEWLHLTSECHLLCLRYPRYFMCLLGASIIHKPLLYNSKPPPPPLASAYYSLDTVIERKNDDCRKDMRLQSAHWSIYCESKALPSH